MHLDRVTRTLVEITLSRRNLLTLLAKLDGFPPGPAWIAIDSGNEVPVLVVRAEEDDKHYSKRDEPPGPMSASTEQRIKEWPW